MQVLELYAEVHEEVASYSYTPISRESCTPERHVSDLTTLKQDTWHNSNFAVRQPMGSAVLHHNGWLTIRDSFRLSSSVHGKIMHYTLCLDTGCYPCHKAQIAQSPTTASGLCTRHTLMEYHCLRMLRRWYAVQQACIDPFDTAAVRP